MEINWGNHHKVSEGKLLKASATLEHALSLFAEMPVVDKMAIDLGCGSGADTSILLKEGWKVLAVDKEVDALKKLFHQEKLNLQILHANFEEDLNLPLSTLVNASFALPFCQPKAFINLWNRIVATIRTGGRFAGHFFGQQDSWASNSHMTFIEMAQLKKMLSGFNIEYLEETNKEGKTLSGSIKHWHVFHVVAAKVVE